MMLDVALVDIDDVRPHEETIPKLLSELTAEIKRDRILKNPIIVDRESLVILDGMHRLAALRNLGCIRIPVCSVDYASSSVKLGCWHRSFVDSDWRDEIRSVLTVLNLEFVETGVYEAEAKVVEEKTVAIESLSGSFVVTDGIAGDRGVFNTVQRIERGLLQLGLKLTYETESDARQKLLSRLVSAVVSYAPATKEMIVQTAMSGHAFPPKTTRHIIPARPMAVNVPLTMLHDRTRPTMMVNDEMVSSLRSRKLTRVLPGSVVEGRRYEENLYVFEG